MNKRVKKRTGEPEVSHRLPEPPALPPAHPPRPNAVALTVSGLLLAAWLVFLATLAALGSFGQ